MAISFVTGTKSMVTLRPVFNTSKSSMAAVKVYVADKFGGQTREGVASGKEAGCIHWDFMYNEERNMLQCREMYADGLAMLAHLDNLGDLFEGFFALGVELDVLEILGPSETVNDAEFRSKVDHLNPVYFEQV
jgi:hypothetical protein